MTNDSTSLRSFLSKHAGLIVIILTVFIVIVVLINLFKAVACDLECQLNKIDELTAECVALDVLNAADCRAFATAQIADDYKR